MTRFDHISGADWPERRLPSLLGNSMMLGAAAGAGTQYQIARSLRFNSGDNPYLSRTPANATNRRTWTFSAWIKRSSFTLSGNVGHIFAGGSAFNDSTFIAINTDAIQVAIVSGGSTILSKLTTAVLRDPTAWYHLVCVLDTTQATAANRSRTYVNGVEMATTGIDLSTQNFDAYINNNVIHAIGSASYSLGGNPFDGYLSEVHFVDGQALTPSSFGEFDAVTGVWNPKRYLGAHGTNGFHLALDWANVSIQSQATPSVSSSGATVGSVSLLNNNRYPGSDTDEVGTNAGQTNIIYQMDFGAGITKVVRSYGFVGSDRYPSVPVGIPTAFTFEASNDGSAWTTLDTRSSVAHSGSGESKVYNVANSTAYRYYRLNCTARSTSGAGSETRITEFILSNSASAGAPGSDASGNGNNWASVKLAWSSDAANDSLTDTPTNYGAGTSGGVVRGNYPIFNKALGYGQQISGPTSTLTISNGGLRIVQTGGQEINLVYGSFAVTSGKWYLEADYGATYLSYPLIGFTDTSLAPSAVVVASNEFQLLGNGGGSNRTRMLAVDFDVGKYWTGTNGTWDSGDPGAGTGGSTFSPVAGKYYAVTCRIHTHESGGFPTSEVDVNFGQRSFVGTVPSGFKVICTHHLPEPSTAVKNPRKGFALLLYSGNSSTQSVTGLSFGPDLIWTKGRNVAVNHRLFDTARGSTTKNKELTPNANLAEGGSSSMALTPTATGFDLSDTSSTTEPNNSGTNYVSWCWKEGASYGFDIVTLAGTGSAPLAVSHGLGAVPHFYVVKCRSTLGDWGVYHRNANAVPQNGYLLLNSTGAFTTASAAWNNTAPTSTQFTLGSSYADTNTYVAYLWTSVAGFSHFGSYTGNGSSDGPFVWCGFRPAFVCVKRTDTADSWYVYDTLRDTFNPLNDYLQTNSSATESTGTAVDFDFTAGGFKVRNSGTSFNGSGATYIFAAFAEQPFKYARAR